MTTPSAAAKLPPLAPGEFRFVTKALQVEPSPDEGGKRRFKTIASSTIKDMSGDEIKLSALQDMAVAFQKGVNIFTDHVHKVDNVFGRSDWAEVRDSGERDAVTGQPIYDLHIAGVVNEPNPRMTQLADSIDGGYVTFGASIGAFVRDHKRNQSGGMDIYHVDTKEASIVGIPMNQRSWTYKAAKAAAALDEVAPGEDILAEDEDDAVVEKADLSAAQRNDMESSEFACPEKRKYPINDAAHVRAALSRIADPTNDQCGRERIIAAARRMGIGDHKAFNDEDLVTWAATEFPATQITIGENGDETFIVKAAEDAAESGETTTPDADGQESDTSETPEPASVDTDQTDTPEAEKAAGLVPEAEVKELLAHVAGLVEEIGVLRAERDALLVKVASYETQAGELTEEVGLAKKVIEKVMAQPLRSQTAGFIDEFTKTHDLFAPEVADYLTKRRSISHE